MKDIFDDFLNLESRHNKSTQIRSVLNEHLNTFSDALITTENSLEDSIKKCNSESKMINEIMDTIQHSEVPSEEYLDRMDELHDLFIDTYTLNEYLNSIAEMKIIFLFKTIEIRLKSAIKIAYPKVSEQHQNNWNWQTFKDHFNSIDKPLSKLNGYNDVDDLRKINNSIKHSGILNNDAKKIKEFIDSKEFESSNINSFIFRIKPKLEIFLKEVAESILSDLYDFDDTRLENLSIEFSNKMDSELLNKFIEKLRSKVR
jgi:hypothetical protein